MNSLLITPSPAVVGTVVTFTASATGAVNYQWDFGDGIVVSFTPGLSSTTHTYAQVGHYSPSVTAQDGLGNTSAPFPLPLTVHYPLSAVQPTNSSTVILDAANHRVWCVNPDQDTVAAVDSTTSAFVMEVPVGKAPRNLAQAGDGTIWVVSQQHPSISVLDPVSGALLHVIALPHGSLPYGLCMTPDGTAAYVSFQGLGGLWKLSTATRTQIASSASPPSARGISVTSDGRVLVARFISPQSNSLLTYNSAAFLAGNHGEVWELNSALNVVRTFNLAIDPGFATADPDFGTTTPPDAVDSRGVPNYLTAMVVTPDGKRLWVPSKKDNIQRGTRTPERDGLTPGSEITYRAIVSSVDLISNQEQLSERFDLKNSEMPQAACTSPVGDLLFIALQGNNLVQVRDLYNLSTPTTPKGLINGFGEATGTTATNGLAPQGLVLDPATKKLFVQNFMGRTISVFDATAVLNSNGAAANLGAPLAVVPTITGGDANDALAITVPPLGGTVLGGKRVFYNAADVRMSQRSYISCAGCHLDGGSDMRVWDFTNRGEGFRNTIILQGHGGTMMGNVHWSANFNEIQDFDNDVFAHFHDSPPAPPSFTGNPGTPNPPLGTPNAGRNLDLDALAGYVSSLTKVPRSPFRNSDGSLTAQGQSGEATFKARNCQKCHTGRNFTDSQVGTTVALDVFPPPAGQIILHNVGTLKPTSGQRLNSGPLPGVDTPTLKGVWETAPYFHDGSAATIQAVFTDASAPTHFGAPPLTAQQQADLAEYMLEIDELDAPPVPSTQVDTITLGAVATGRPYSFATAGIGSYPFVDRSYTLTTLPAPLPGAILLRTAEDDKAYSGGGLDSFVLTSAADVYVFYDSRATSKPSWLDASWTASPAQNVTISPGLTMKSYLKSFTTGFPVTVTLGGNLQGGATGALRNYFAIINQAGGVFEEGPLSQLEWAHDRDADGDGLHDEYEAVSQLSPWVVNTGGTGTADEDKLVSPGGPTRFQDQAAFEAPPFVGGGGGGGGGCGVLGLELLAILGFVRELRRRPCRLSSTRL